MIEKILNRREFEGQPPVLVDIGASGRFHPEWKILGKFSVCLAFDADEREMGYAQSASGRFRRFVVTPAVVTEKKPGLSDFYLTKFPFCSSVLRPDSATLEDWAFADFFAVEKKTRLRSENLQQVLKREGLDYVDWFKTDSQGIDLRLFKSLGPRLAKKVLAAEFEPGIINAYHGEDKLHHLLDYMDKGPFWMNSMRLDGVPRVHRKVLKDTLTAAQCRYLHLAVKRSPAYAEVSYLNSMEQREEFTQRDFLLACAFGLVKGQFGFVLLISRTAQEAFGDPFFRDIENHALRVMKRGPFLMPVASARKIVEAFFKLWMD